MPFVVAKKADTTNSFLLRCQAIKNAREQAALKAGSSEFVPVSLSEEGDVATLVSAIGRGGSQVSIKPGHLLLSTAKKVVSRDSLVAPVLVSAEPGHY
ncbi:hypothetical protein FKM82_023385 [Ascaphus truei]